MADDTQAPSLAFRRTEGEIRHRFYRSPAVAAHVALTSGVTPRIIVAFPAGNRGLLLQGATHEVAVSLDTDGPIVALDPEADGIAGIVVPIIATTAELRFAQTVLGNIRTLRDVGYGVALIPRLRRNAVVVTGQAHDRALAIERPGLDGRHVHAIAIEPRGGSDVAAEPDGTIILRAGPDGTVRADLIATCDATPLTPIPVDHLLRPAVRARLHGPEARRDLEALAFLSYDEKLLAGSWQYLTYFGRDTLIALRLLASAAHPHLIEAGLGAVLDRISPIGEVAHEESLGEYALLERERTRRLLSADTPRVRTPRMAPLLDYKMVDDDFLLAPTLAHALFNTPEPPSDTHIDAFLRQSTATGISRGEAIRRNLQMVCNRARAYAHSRSVRDLIHVRSGVPVGNWRDSREGLGGGITPYDVNVALVPAALTAIARLATIPAIGLDPAIAAEATLLARVWQDTAHHFTVTIPQTQAHAQIRAFAEARGLPNLQTALQAIGDGPVIFPAIALDESGIPVPIMHSDDSLVLLFTAPSVEALEGIARRLVTTYPAGLHLPGVGTLVANPVYASHDLQDGCTAGHYHGTVVWSWPQAAYAAGLARQIARADLPTTTRTSLRAAQTAVWAGIDASADLRTSEFWTFTVADGHYVPRPAQGAGIVNESNPVQLWSAVYLGLDRDHE